MCSFPKICNISVLLPIITVLSADEITFTNKRPDTNFKFWHSCFYKCDKALDFSVDIISIPQTEATSAVLLEPSSPYFLNTMVISVGLLLLAVACGLLYQACYKWRCGTTSDKGTLYWLFALYIM